MPIYEFECKKCAGVGEYLVFGSIDGEVCKFCGSPELVQLMSVFAYKSEGKFKHGGGAGCAGCKTSSCSSCA